MYERQKKKIDDFKPMDSDDVVKDSKKAARVDTLKKEEVLKEPDSTKIESMNKEDAGESSEKVSNVSKKRKGGLRMKRMSKRKKTESDLEEEDDLKTFLKIVPDKEGIIDFEVLEKRFPIINWESKFYHYDRHGAEDLVELYNLKMNSGRIKKDGILRARISMRILSLQVIVLKICLDSFKRRLMKLEAMIEERRIFKCWFHHHTTNSHQFTMSNSHQELASPEQTTYRKNFLNPLMADSLPKNYMFTQNYMAINALCCNNEALAIPEQTTTGKETSNPFMADTNGQIRVLPPKTAEEILARERERKARTTLLMSIPEDHLAKFHKMTDAKDMWEAIKSRFGGNDESKKMQKYILKQQFESFSVSNSEGLHKGYDRFQSLLSQLEIHGAGVSTEDANQKFLRSLPASWSQVSLIMRTKPGVDTLSFDDLYNNLRVFESDIKGSTASSSSTQNVAFVSSESTSSTNNVSTAYGVSTSSGHNSQKQRENSSSYTDELMYSFFAN
ncbi:hypothetical protein Tco_0966460 [Tanacetum coccineum]